MRFSPPLSAGRLIRRYKRFLADIRRHDGTEFTAHCPNTGSMRHCGGPGSRVWYSVSDDPKRKYPATLEAIQVAGGAWAGINTMRANRLVKELLLARSVPDLAGYEAVNAEVKLADSRSRIDFCLDYRDRPACFVEVKNVTLAENEDHAEPGRIGYFPDAVSERGARHLRDLASLVQTGHRTVLMYCVQHTGIDVVRPAAHIDPSYADALRDAVDAGVEVMAWRARLSRREFVLAERVPVEVG